MKYDVIIIGSGLGGLSAGAYLAKNDKKVLILEQHSLIGGCATCFKRKNSLIEVGLHEMDFGDFKTDMKHVIFEKLDINNRLEFVSLKNCWSIKTKNYNLTLAHNIENVKNILKNEFPKESKGIDEYFKKLHLQAYAVRRFVWDMNFIDKFFFPFTTAWIFLKNKILNQKVDEVLNSIIKDKRLKKILNANLGYYHHDSKEFIFSYHAIAQKHYYDGSVYIKGGSKALSDALVSVIKENNGEVLTKANVIKILTKNKKAFGVEYIKNNENIKIYADKIIANCDPLVVYKDLLGDLDLKEDIDFINSKRRAVSLVNAYFIFDRNISKIYENMDYCNFIFDDDYLNNDETNILNLNFDKRPLSFVNYSKIDSGIGNIDDSKFIGVASFNSSYEEWDFENEKYKKLKEEVLDMIINKLDEFFPNLSSFLIHKELATPKTIKRYIKTKNGTAYGFSQDNEGIKNRLNYKSKGVKNLYFASSFTFPGGGFSGAIIGGYFTANKIIR